LSPDLDSLRLLALSVAGVSRLADHHDGVERPAHTTSHGALRVFDDHIEIDIVLASGHTVTAAAGALRTVLSPLFPGRDIHVTVTDVDAPGPDARRESPGPRPASRRTAVGEPLDRARAAARAVLAEVDALAVEGLSDTGRSAVTGLCRILIAFDVDPVSRCVLVRRLREHLTTAGGPTGRGLVDRLDAVEDVEDAH
jgi:hypothetical protein